VAVATRRQAWKLWKMLDKFLGVSVALALSGVKKSAKSWLVSTFGSVPRSKAGEYDILLLPNAEEAIGPRAIDMVVRMQFRWIYAFIRPQRRSDSLVKMRLEHMAGSIIHCITSLSICIARVYRAGTHGRVDHPLHQEAPSADPRPDVADGCR
jgi:hypothetical protein